MLSQSRTKIEKVRGMNASLAAPAGGLREREPGHVRITRRQVAMALVLALLGALAAKYTIDTVSSAGQSYSAVVTNSATYDLNFPNTGRVVAILVKAGQPVKKGQVLARQDTSGLASQVAADQEKVRADQAAVAEDRNPQVSAAQATQYQLEVQQAEAALSDANTALANATSAGKASVAGAQATVVADQGLLAADAARFNQTCPGGPVPPSPGLTGAALTAAEQSYNRCEGLQQQFDKDTADLQTAAPAVAAAEAQAQSAVSAASAAVKNAQAQLSLAENKVTLATVPADTAALAQAEALLSADQSQLTQAQQNQSQAVLTAPADGIVAEVFGAAGEYLGPDGVKEYQSPSGVPSSQSPGFQLFPSQTAPSGPTSGAPGTEPLIEIIGGRQQVMAQVPEGDIQKFRIGNTARVSISAISVRTTGVVDEMFLTPTRTPGSVDYDVVVDLTDSPRLLPGMTATIRPG